jgi:phosphoenolpyruvate carboxylase
VLGCYAALRHQLRNHGRDGIGALIVSMTRQLSDLLVVYLLAREAGVMRWTPEGLLWTLPVVPLETLDDLERSACPTTRSSPTLLRNAAWPITDRPHEGSLPPPEKARPASHDRL